MVFAARNRANPFKYKRKLFRGGILRNCSFSAGNREVRQTVCNIYREVLQKQG
jgi:hypothetical protein